MKLGQEGLSLVLFKPESDDERKWLEDYTNSESWQWIAGCLAVDAVYSGSLIEALRDAGFEIN